MKITRAGTVTDIASHEQRVMVTEMIRSIVSTSTVVNRSTTAILTLRLQESQVQDMNAGRAIIISITIKTNRLMVRMERRKRKTRTAQMSKCSLFPRTSR